MRKTEVRQSLIAKKLKIPTTTEAAVARRAMVRFYLLAMLVSVSSTASHGEFLPQRPSDSVVESGSHVSALYIMGDSSVDCGENTLFYPLLHRNLSLLPCNGSDSTLLPHLLGSFPLSFLIPFTCMSLVSFFSFLNLIGSTYPLAFLVSFLETLYKNLFMYLFI